MTAGAMKSVYEVVVQVRANRYGWDKLIIYSYPTMALASECLFKAKAKGLVCWLRDEALQEGRNHEK
jgi:hypothetical protein